MRHNITYTWWDCFVGNPVATKIANVIGSQNCSGLAAISHSPRGKCVALMTLIFTFLITCGQIEVQEENYDLTSGTYVQDKLCKVNFYPSGRIC